MQKKKKKKKRKKEGQIKNDFPCQMSKGWVKMYVEWRIEIDLLSH